MAIYNFSSEDKLYEVLSKGVPKLIKDEKDLSAKDRSNITELKQKIIESELINLNREDVLGDVLLIINNIPNDLTPLEKVRWVYINMGKLFSYDYRAAGNPNFSFNKEFHPSEFIGRYQSCVQISELLTSIFNNIEGVQCKVIERKLTNMRLHFGSRHRGNEVIVQDANGTLKLILDLTLDLYLIQSDCMTKHFGYEDDGTGTYDIIPLSQIREMDKKVGLVLDDDEYTDTKVNRLREVSNTISELDDKSVIDYKISLINKLVKRFPGYLEGKLYINMLFSELLQLPCREFNLRYNKDSDINLKTVYRITNGNAEKWIIYSNNSGFISTSKEKIKEMLDSGWTTKSKTLSEYLNTDESNKNKGK